MGEKTTFTVGPAESGERLDIFLTQRLGDKTRSYIRNLILAGNVQINGSYPGKPGIRLKEGQEVAISLPPVKELDVAAEKIPLDIIYEDAAVVVINKPQGMVVHPAPGHFSNTLVNALLYHCRDLSGINGVLRPGIVHRLDKDTSGLLLAAKNDAAHLNLSRQLRRRQVKREYLALVKGQLTALEGIIEAPLGRHPRKRMKMAVVVSSGRKAVTHYQVLEEFKESSLLSVRLETGRTHQIRVHMAYIGHPVLGDPLYGKEKDKYGLPGQALHSFRLGFFHPTTGKWLEFQAEPPLAFRELLNKLREDKKE